MKTLYPVNTRADSGTEREANQTYTSRNTITFGVRKTRYAGKSGKVRRQGNGERVKYSPENIHYKPINKTGVVRSQGTVQFERIVFPRTANRFVREVHRARYVRSNRVSNWRIPTVTGFRLLAENGAFILTEAGNNLVIE